MDIYNALLNPQSGHVASVVIETRDGVTELTFPGATEPVIVREGQRVKFEATPTRLDAGPFCARLVRL